MPKDLSPELSEEKKKKGLVAEVVELGLCLACAALLALAIKYGLIEAFVIPSGSMEPTLHGRTDGGDRVVCTKINYFFREPRRWEIFVFLYPYEQAIRVDPTHDHRRYRNENFIKRCIGLPGETIALTRGDVYVRRPDDPTLTFRREVKPDAIQRRMWIPVYEEDFSDLQTGELMEFWSPSGEGNWDVTPAKTLKMLGKQAHLRFRPRTREAELPGIPDRYVRRQVVTFRCPRTGCEGRLAKTVWNQKITGRCPRCGQYLLEKDVIAYQRRSELALGSAELVGVREGDAASPGYGMRIFPWHYVPDLRVRCRIRLGKEGAAFAVELRDEPHSIQAVFQGDKIQFRRDGRVFETVSKRIEVGSWHTIEFYQADGAIRGYLDGEAILDHSPATFARPPEGTSPTGTGVMVSGIASVEIDDLAIDRDIYYFAGGRGMYAAMVGETMTLGEKEYLGLGDNCPSSNDSRCWGPIPKENLRGPALFIWWPPHRVRWID